MMIPFNPHILKKCYKLGCAAYPEEACGMISGKVDIDNHLDQVHSMKNVMNDYHAENPDLYPRTNRNAYMIDPLQQIKLERDLKKQQCRVKIIFHTHPDVGAYFSDKDKEDALWNGEPRHPDLHYLVCGIKNGNRDGAVLVMFNLKTKNFDITRID